MCQVIGGGSFSTPGAPKPLNRFTRNLSSLITSTVRPDTWPPKMQGGVGIRVKLYPRVLSFHFFLVTSTRSQLTVSGVDFRSMQPKPCFAGGLVGEFLWGRFIQGSNLPFYPPPKKKKKKKFNGPTKAIIFHESYQKTSMCNGSSVKVAYWILNMGMNVIRFHLQPITWYRACAMQSVTINMKILGTPQYLWDDLS